MTSQVLPLEGVRVIEFVHMVMGPTCGLVLGYQYRADGGAWSTRDMTTSNTFGLADGLHTVTVRAFDLTGSCAYAFVNFTLDATGRQSIAGEVQSLQEQMTSLSNPTVQGRYIFGGDQDSNPPYAVDLTAANGVTRLTNSPATRRVESAAGGSFAVSQGAQDILDARNPDDTLASSNVFAALNALRLGLLANNTTQITAASASLQLASDHIKTAQSFYGTVENRITEATTCGADYDVQLKTELSQKEDADVTSAALAITQGNTQLEAAFQMQAKMPRTTLFDFMG